MLDHIRTVIDYAVFQDWSALLRTIATADLPEKPPRPAIASPQTKQSAVALEIRPNKEKIENELIMRITAFGPGTEPPLFPPPATLDDVRPLTLRPVLGKTREGKLWNEFIARYHYLGYKTLVGAQIRYAVHDRHGSPIAMLGFSTAAWKLAPRDHFIGWSPPTAREKPPARVRQPQVPHPALDPYPQPRLPHPRHHPPTLAPGLGRALQHHPRSHRNLRPDPALHWRRLQGIRLVPCRRHPEARTL